MQGTISEPLSWEQARARLRLLLEHYVEDPPPRRRAGDRDLSIGSESILSWCINRDFDLYFGAVAFSIALLVMCCFSFSASVGGRIASSTLRPSASGGVYKSQLLASLFLIFGSCLSLWLVRRRRFLSLHDSDNAKRREIRRFVRALKGHEENKRKHNVHACQHGFQLKGTSLTDIYPVYRKCTQHQGESPCWSRIPSLLLVEGDIIALQCGDIVPANCVMMKGHKHTKVRVNAGQRLSIDLIGESLDDVMKSLPRGRSTILPGSSHLLTICNRMRVFLVLNTPLEEFINRCPVTTKPSQVSRRVNAARQSLSILSIFFLATTSVILLSRIDLSKEDLSLVLHIPMLAAMGCLPIVGPAFLFFLECLGTARILVTVHPYASSTSGSAESLKTFSRTKLLLRYMTATCLSRLSLWRAAEMIGRLFGRTCPSILFSRDVWTKSDLVRVPPASLNLLEKLGVATAFTLVDDELVCDPHAIPQQLLVPSAKGLKLLDLCPCYESDEDSDDVSRSDSASRRRWGKSFDSDSESEDGSQILNSSLRRKIIRRKMIRRSSHRQLSEGNTVATEDLLFEVQFEDPTWWHYLPSLKCIGLASLLLDENRFKEDTDNENQDMKPRDSWESNSASTRETSLVNVICHERQSKQLRSLAHCIGFSTSSNAHGSEGDISPFVEYRRLHILSSALIKERLVLDAHERSSEQSKWWGLIRPDSTSVVVQDTRTKAFQLLTVGNPTVVIDLCQEAWQGEISTILPLGPIDRATIIETTNNWKLGDLDVQAFSYSPVPLSLEHTLSFKSDTQIYLLDHSVGEQIHTLQKDKNMSAEWSFMKNQIFLGVIGSLVVPRREIQSLLPVLSVAGVRFVYFSPRNMRRQKELASQMGIDVAWNCAISLRPLESGKEDPHRMVSNYADWDVNAKLPHGVEDVKKHLQEVDNVPLLVSLYTDATKETTREMVEVFQAYNDTVISVGLSHLPRNDGIFSAADIAVGIDILTDDLDSASRHQGVSLSTGHVLPAELEFVSSIAAHSCAFRFRGATSVSHISCIIEQGRVALEASVSAAIFLIFGCLSLSFFLLFAVCEPSSIVPYVPPFGTVLLMQIILPCLGFSLAMAGGDQDVMQRVPPKNDQSVTFARREGWKIYSLLILKAIPPALLPQLLHFIIFGELLLHFEPDVVLSSCPTSTTWSDIARCKKLISYAGPSRISSGILVIVELFLCVIAASAGFLSRMEPLVEQLPWQRNRAWMFSAAIAFSLTIIYGHFAVPLNVKAALPWYYYVIAAGEPIMCLVWVELCKKSEIRLERRAEKLRRLQFETRLGAWSPK